MSVNTSHSCFAFYFFLLFSADDPLNSKMLMVLEYVEGGSLFNGTKLSPKRRLTELSARKYFRDVLQVSIFPKSSPSFPYFLLGSILNFTIEHLLCVCAEGLAAVSFAQAPSPYSAFATL